MQSLKHQPTHLFRYRNGFDNSFSENEYPDDEDQWMSATSSQAKIILVCDEFPILKETQCGYWVNANEWDTKIRQYQERKRFVLKDTKKRFAHETRQDALSSYIYRKKKQISYINSGLECAKYNLKEANRLLEILQAK